MSAPPLKSSLAPGGRGAGSEGASTSTATPLGLYLHIPFCRKRCKFCYFRVYTDKNANEVEQYVAALSRNRVSQPLADHGRPAVQVRLFRRWHPFVS